MSKPQLRLLILGAHPDDAEYHAGGLMCMYRTLGHKVRVVSVTDGGAGHHQRPREQLVALRREEATAAGRVIGAEYDVWGFPDGQLIPSLDVRTRIIREIRTFAPDLVLTHRTNDYHPDHRAVGQAVQDASYMVTVPMIVPDVDIVQRDPVVAYMTDLFTRPCPLRADIVLDVDAHVDSIVAMLACHRSQVFEFLPFNEAVQDQVPHSESEKLKWLRGWYARHVSGRADRFRPELIRTYGEDQARQIQFAEAYEISEYASALDEATRRRLFPGPSEPDH